MNGQTLAFHLLCSLQFNLSIILKYGNNSNPWKVLPSILYWKRASVWIWIVLMKLKLQLSLLMQWSLIKLPIQSSLTRSVVQWQRRNLHIQSFCFTLITKPVAFLTFFFHGCYGCTELSLEALLCKTILDMRWFCLKNRWFDGKRTINSLCVGTHTEVLYSLVTHGQSFVQRLKS